MQHAEKVRKPLLPLADARANRAEAPLRRPAGAAVRRLARGAADARRARAVHRLAVLLPRLGPEGQVPGDPRQPGGAASSTTTRRRSCATILQGASLRAARHLRLLAGARRGRRRRRRRRPAVLASCASRQTTATAGRTAASPTSSRRPPTTSARSRSRSTAPTSSPRATRRSTTTTRRSSSRRSPTASPRRSPSGCTSACGASGTRPTSTCSADDLLRENFRGIRPAFGYPACPDHSEKPKLVRPARRRERSGRADRELRDDARRPRSAASTCTIRRRSTSRSAGSGATSSRTTPRARASRSPKPSAGSPPAFPKQQASGRSAILARQAPSGRRDLFLCGRH